MWRRFHLKWLPSFANEGARSDFQFTARRGEKIINNDSIKFAGEELQHVYKYDAINTMDVVFFCRIFFFNDVLTVWYHYPFLAIDTNRDKQQWNWSWPTNSAKLAQNEATVMSKDACCFWMQDRRLSLMLLLLLLFNLLCKNVKLLNWRFSSFVSNQQAVLHC